MVNAKNLFVRISSLSTNYVHAFIIINSLTPHGNKNTDNIDD